MGQVVRGSGELLPGGLMLGSRDERGNAAKIHRGGDLGGSCGGSGPGLSCGLPETDSGGKNCIGAATSGESPR